ncbi:hypothetical protein ACTI_66530 [Actinoplanes sp. OR16]|uniref:MmpS family transport accessory protein n=1 Tax=Actinoplanes sp. OR16 TaxID=946334 RepID=UPI000F6C149E|nr:MmpS family transport accessory protein [Actinoplanes sp. OR16]BBH69968.1 hypothetical protein ACTI_66530 [Actinoplanes sp. OR16]
MKFKLVAVFVVLVLSGFWWIHVSVERSVRLEISTGSGSVGRVQWRVGSGDEQSDGGRLATPWTLTVTVKRLSGFVTLAALSRPDDTVTCRILVDGEPAAESTSAQAAGCTATLG